MDIFSFSLVDKVMCKYYFFARAFLKSHFAKNHMPFYGICFHNNVNDNVRRQV